MYLTLEGALDDVDDAVELFLDAIDAESDVGGLDAIRFDLVDNPDDSDDPYDLDDLDCLDCLECPPPKPAHTALVDTQLDTQFDCLVYDIPKHKEEEAAISTQTPVFVLDKHGNAHATSLVATPAGANTEGLPECETHPHVNMDFVPLTNPLAQFTDLSGLNVTQNGEAPLVQQPQHGIIPTCAPSNGTSLTAVPSSTVTGATHNSGVKRKKGQQKGLEFVCSLLDTKTTPNKWFKKSPGIITQLVISGWIIDARTEGELRSGKTPVHVVFVKPMSWSPFCETVHVRSLLALFEALLLHMSCKESGAEKHEAHVDSIIELFMHEKLSPAPAAQILANRQSHLDNSGRVIRFRALDRKSQWALVDGILSVVQ